MTYCENWKGGYDYILAESKLSSIIDRTNTKIADVQRLGIESIAIPPLGCGNGGLDWNDVRPLIIQAFENLPEIKIIIFEPNDAPTVNKVNLLPVDRLCQTDYL